MLRGDRLEKFVIWSARWLRAVGTSSLLLFDIDESYRTLVHCS
jgi:hypothetical protein